MNKKVINLYSEYIIFYIAFYILYILYLYIINIILCYIISLIFYKCIDLHLEQTSKLISSHPEMQRGLFLEKHIV